MKIRSARQFPILSAVLLFCLGAGATTLESMSVERMARVAHVIVRARCISNRANWDAGEIWTSTSFEILETWKGTPPEHITVRLLGGTVGQLTSTVSGVPRFLPGEEVVLFLESTPQGDFSIVSWQQGTFRIRRDPRTETQIITQDTASFATFDSRSRRFETIGIRGLALEAFRSRVQSAVLAPGGTNP